MRVCEIPAPPFKEEARGQELKRLFEGLGLKDVRIDKAGNVIGVRPGRAAHPNLVFSAHLDTVFPEGTDVKVKREGAVLKGPGIGDDCRGLAVMLAVIRALNEAHVETPGTITFVADVGEEGLGDLRGMKSLFYESLKGQIDKFISVDGTGLGITHVGRGQQSLPRDVQGSGRPQLRRLRYGQSDSGDGAGDRQDRRLRSSQPAEDDVQCGARGRRHFGECHPVRGVDGGGYALFGPGGAQGRGPEVQRRGARGGGGGEPALEQSRPGDVPRPNWWG